MAVTYPTTSLELSRQYTSFSGVDIRAVVDGNIIGTLQGISYAVQREKAPIYVMGRVDPLSFSRGKRGIAGTIITLMLDSHIIKDPNSPFSSYGFIADDDEIIATPGDLNDASATDDLDVVEASTFDAGDLGDQFSLQTPWYVDQIPRLISPSLLRTSTVRPRLCASTVLRFLTRARVSVSMTS